MSGDGVGDGFFVALFAGLVEDAALKPRRQVLLGDPVIVVGVGVEVACAMAEALAVSAVVSQGIGDFGFAFFFNGGEGIEEAHDAVGFGAGGEVKGGLGEGVATFGKTDAIEGLGAGVDDGDCGWVGHAHIFPRKNKHSSKHKSWVFSGVHHPREPIQCSIGI